MAGVALLLGAACIGCGSAPSSKPASSSALVAEGRAKAALAGYRTEPTGLPRWPALPRRPPVGKAVYYIHTGSGSGQLISASIKRATATLGWRYRAITFNPANLATANSAYLSAVNAGADAIISTGVDHHALAQGLNAARARDIPVVQIQSVEAPRSSRFAQVANNVVNRSLYAKVVALGALADAAKRGVVAHVGVVTTSGIPAIYGMAQAKVRAVTEVCQKCSATIIDVPVAQATSGQAAQAVVSFIQQHPETNYISVDGPFAAGGRAALDAAGAEGVKIVGLSPTAAQNQELETGDSLLWVNISYGYYGWTAVDAVARALTGGDPSIHSREHDIVWLVDKDNMTFDPQTLPDFPAGYETQFKRLWRVG